MKKGKFRHLIFAFVATTPALLALSCETKNTASIDKEQKEEIDTYFKNLSIRNTENLSIDLWISKLNSELKNDSSKNFSFNRSSNQEAIDLKNSSILNSENTVKIIKKHFNNSSTVAFKSNLAYDLRFKKINDNMLKVTVSIFDKDNKIESNKLVSKEFDLNFQNTLSPKIKNDFEKIIKPLQISKNLIEELKTISTEKLISASYQNLKTLLPNGDLLVSQKSQDLSKINEYLTALNSAKNKLNIQLILFNNQISSSLQIEIINSQKVVLDSKLSLNNQVKIKVNSLEQLITEANNYLVANKITKHKINEFITNLTKLSTEIKNLNTIPPVVDKPIHPTPPNMPKPDDVLTAEKLKTLFENFDSKIELTGVNPSEVLPSSVKKTNIKIKENFALPGLTVNFVLEPNDLFGKLSILANVNQNGLIANSSLIVLKDNFKQDENKVNLLNKNLFSEWQTIYNLPKDDIKEYASPLQHIRISIDRIESNTFDVQNINDILANKVDTLLFIINKDKSVETVNKFRNDFLNKEESDKFSKLNYLSTLSYNVDKEHKIFDRWEYIKRLVFLNKLAKRDDIKSDSSFNLVTLFADQKIEKFILTWFKDYINKYYNDSIVPFPKYSTLFEFDQPFRILELFYLLKDDLDEQTKAKTLSVLNHFSSSFTEYGTRKGTTYNGVKKVIDKPLQSINALSVINYLTLNNKNSNKILEEFEKYKSWIKNTDLFALRRNYNDSLSTTSFFKKLDDMNLYYNQLSKIFKQIKVEEIDYSQVVNFIDRYTGNIGSFNNMNGHGGVFIMQAVAQVYNVLKFNLNQQNKALNLIKTKVIENHKKTDFQNYSDLLPGYKQIWNTFFSS